MKPAIKAVQITKHFSHPQKIKVLDQVSLQLAFGKSACISGASGEGKTTLLQILGLLQNPDSGEVFIGGVLANKANSAVIRNKKIGFVFQSYYLLEDLTAIENVLLPARIAKNKKKNKELLEFGHHLLETVGLVHRKDFYAKQLSGGERQRISIARAFCNDPEIILADEPSGNLDHKNSEKIHSLLLQCTQNSKKSLIVVSHDQELAKLCDQTYHLSEAKLFEN